MFTTHLLTQTMFAYLLLVVIIDRSVTATVATDLAHPSPPPTRNITGLIDLNQCSNHQLVKLHRCLDQAEEEVIEFGDFGQTFEVHCCIYAKFRNCLEHEEKAKLFCGQTMTSLMVFAMKAEQNVVESPQDEHHCLDRKYPSFECSLFYHQMAFIAGLGIFFLVMGGMLSWFLIPYFSTYYSEQKANNKYDVNERDDVAVSIETLIRAKPYVVRRD